MPEVSFSVVIPYYNRSKQIRRLLLSLKNQTHQALEIFIVDNGSCEEDIKKALLEIRDFPELPLTLVSTLERGNANFARNLGTELSTSSHVAYLDSDDWWDESHLHSAYKLLSTTPTKSTYSSYNIHKPNKILRVKNRGFHKKESACNFLFGKDRGFAQSSGLIIERNAATSCKWSETLKRNQDYDFFIRVQYKTSFCFTGEATVHIDWEHEPTKAIDYQSTLQFFDSTLKSNANKKQRLFYLILTIKESYLRSNGPLYRSQLISRLGQDSKLFALIIKSTPDLFISFLIKIFDEIKSRKN